MIDSWSDAAAGSGTRTAGEVARLLGIAESTLRAWHRRYGVGPHPARPGGYRRYSDDDVAALQRMHDLIKDGMLPSDAAQAVRTSGQGASADHWLADLLVAAYELDSVRCRLLLERAVAEDGVLHTWERLCRPALAAIDAAQQAEHRSTSRGEEDCVEREHVLSWAIAAMLHRASPLTDGVRPRVVLACADAEQHTLALEALAAVLAERGVPVRMLGASVPPTSLRRAVAAAEPDVAVIWSQRRATASPDGLALLRRLPVRRVAAGPGWSADRLAGAQLVTTLPDAVTAVSEATNAGRTRRGRRPHPAG